MPQQLASGAPQVPPLAPRRERAVRRGQGSELGIGRPACDTQARFAPAPVLEVLGTPGR